MELSARIGTVTTAEPFVIARGTEEVNEVLWVELWQDGVVGRGEGAPIPRYDESAQSALAYVEELGPKLGDDPFAIEEIMERLPRREFAARSAIDSALHDLQGKLVGRPVYQLLGLPRFGPATSLAGVFRRATVTVPSCIPTTTGRRSSDRHVQHGSRRSPRIPRCRDRS